jgi:hypothetical protein
MLERKGAGLLIHHQGPKGAGVRRSIVARLRICSRHESEQGIETETMFIVGAKRSGEYFAQCSDYMRFSIDSTRVVW